MVDISGNKEPMQWNRLIREYFRTDHKTFLITFTEKRQSEVFDAITKHTDLFILLELDNIKALHGQSDLHVINIKENSNEVSINSIVDDVFSGRNCLEHSADINSYNNGLVHAVMFEICDTNKEKIRQIGFENMLRNLPKEFYLCSTYWYDQCLCYFKFSNIKRYKPFKKEKKPIAVLICEGIGSGDFCMMYSYINEFIKREKKAGKEIHIITVKNSGLYNLLNIYTKECKILGSQYNYIHPRFYETILKSGTYSECYCISMIPFRFPKKLYHIADIWSMELDIDKDFDFFKFADASHLTSDDLLSETGKAFIGEVLQMKRPIIGLQLHTDSYGNEAKNWSYGNIREFAVLCKNKGFTLLNLTPHHYGDINGLIEASFLKKHELFHLISKLNAVIGVDSCCGHMAALLGVANITVWGRQFPDIVNPHDSYPILRSFRTMRLNYSITSKSLNAADIRPEILFKCLNDILTGEIVLKKDKITIEETLSGMWTATVENKNV